MRLKIIVEIVNPGGLYGNARPENFPSVNDYRNPVIAEAMKVLGYVNRFNHGIARVQRELEENGNPVPVFDYQRMGVFGVTVVDALYHEKGTEIKNISGSVSGDTTIVGTLQDSAKNSEKIVDLIFRNSKITTVELAELLGITEKGVEYHLNKLQKDNK